MLTMSRRPTNGNWFSQKSFAVQLGSSYIEDNVRSPALASGTNTTTAHRVRTTMTAGVKRSNSTWFYFNEVKTENVLIRFQS